MLPKKVGIMMSEERISLKTYKMLITLFGLIFILAVVGLFQTVAACQKAEIAYDRASSMEITRLNWLYGNLSELKGFTGAITADAVNYSDSPPALPVKNEETMTSEPIACIDGGGELLQNGTIITSCGG